MDNELLLATITFQIAMCFSPGPNNVLCAAHGSQHGLKGTIPLIMGMAVGWSALGLFIAAATVFIEENQNLFQLLTYIGAAYIAYLSFKVATSSPIDSKHQQADRLGFRTGMILQVVNGKAWIHFLVLLTAFGGLFGTGFASKALLILLNLSCGLPAVITWAAFGTLLRKIFSTEQSAKNLNMAMGVALFAVAIWIVIPH